MATWTVRKALIREIQRLQARREPLNISAVKRNHPKLIGQVYGVRPFWGWKRALEEADLDYSKINIEYRDYVTCEICGRDFGALSYHLISQHDITPEEYQGEYPGAEIVCETIRIGIAGRRRRHRDHLPHWEAIWTPEYVLDRIAELHRRNLPLNFQWAHEHEKALATQAVAHFGSWDKALRRIGLDPTRVRLFRPTWRGISPWRQASKATILAELHRRTRANEPVSWKTILPLEFGPALLERAKKLFGSWSAALIAAGIDPFHGGNSFWANASKADVLAEISWREQTGQPLRAKMVWREKWGQPLMRRGSELFGSWSDALRAAGLEREAGRSQWAAADKPAIVHEILRRHRAGESITVQNVLREKWGRALINRAAALFGSWTAARLAAGLKPPPNVASRWPRANKAAIIAEIRHRNETGQSLQTRKVERTKWGHPLINHAKELFGSWGQAIVAAGLEPPPGMMSPWAKADTTLLLAEIRRRARAGETLGYGKVAQERWGSALRTRAENLFGSWSAALAAAEINRTR